MIDRLGGGKRRELTAAEKGTRLIARIVFDIDICKGLPERVPATGSRRKSRDHLPPRSGRILPPCDIGSSSTCLRLGFLRRTRVHHHKLGWTRFRTTLPLQERRYQMSVSQGFSSHRSKKINPHFFDRHNRARQADAATDVAKRVSVLFLAFAVAITAAGMVGYRANTMIANAPVSQIVAR